MDPTLITKVSAVLGNLPVYLTAVTALLSAIVGVALLVPGDQPEKFLKGVVDILSKFSRKP